MADERKTAQGKLAGRSLCAAPEDDASIDAAIAEWTAAGFTFNLEGDAAAIAEWVAARFTFDEELTRSLLSSASLQLL